MPGVRALYKTYIGQESTAGGALETPTVVWRGTSELDDTRETEFPDENIGIMGGGLRSYVAKLGGEATLEGDATFEQLPYIFDAAFYGSTAARDSTSSGYIRVYDWQVTAADKIASTNLATLVIDNGDNQCMERAQFGFVREFTLSGSAGEAWEVSSTVETRGVSTLVSTDVVPSTDVILQTVETALFSKAKLYIDAPGSIGTTQNAMLLNASLKITTGWQAMLTASGRLDFTNIKHVGGEGTLELTFEHDGSANAEQDAWRSQIERGVRIVTDGSAYASAAQGQTYSGKKLIIDAYGKWEDFEPLGEQDGNNIVTGTLRIGYSAAAGKRLTITVVNELATLP